MDLVDVTSYRRAEDRGALALAPGETVLAGGTWLFSEPQPGTTGLVDLTALGWPAWERTPTALRIAATCTVAELLAVPAEELGAGHALARQAADALLMSFKVQRLATVGGNVCMALPAGAMTSWLVALDAEAVVWTPDGGERREPVAELVTGVRRTTLGPGEVLRSVEVPAHSLAARTAFRRTSLAPLGRSAVVVTASTRPGATLVCVTAATTRPVVLRFPLVPDADALAAALAPVECWYDDPHGPPDWRAAMSARLAEECRRELEEST